MGNIGIMAMFWTAVVFYMCGRTVEVCGTTDKDVLPTSLARTVTSTALPTVIPTEDESIKLVVRTCLELIHDSVGKYFSLLMCSIKSQHENYPIFLPISFFSLSLMYLSRLIVPDPLVYVFPHYLVKFP